MATTITNTDLKETPLSGAPMSAWPNQRAEVFSAPPPSTQGDALQALLAFSALHEQVRRRKALAARHENFDLGASTEFEPAEVFVLDEVLQLVAERAIAITGADGIAIALAENNEIVLRASSGTVRPDVGARIDRDSAFSGACFRTAQIINCDDTETDPRVNLQACRKLGSRSMIAVPLCGRRRVIGLLEAFSAEPFGFNDSDICSLSLLAELIVGALKPEDEDRFAQSAQVAAAALEEPPASKAPKEPPAPPIVPPPAKTIAPAKPAEKTAGVAPQPVVEAPVIEEKKSAEVQPSLVPEAAPQPVLTFGQPEPQTASQRPYALIVLVCIVVATAFAGGVWWKLKTAQLGSAIVTSEQSSPKSSAMTKDETPAAPVPAVPSLNSATPSADTMSDDADNSPATDQELTKLPRVTGIRHWSSSDSSTVVIDLEDQVQYEEHQIANPTRFYYDLRDTQLSSELAGKSIDIGDGFLTRVRIAQPVAGMTRVVLETKAGTEATPGVSLEPNPYRLVIQVRKPGADSKAVNLFPTSPQTEKSKLAIVVPPPTKEDLQLRAHVAKMKIVVDAGHGGWDLGTVGKRGLLEKDLVLEIAQRLGKLLESRLGAEVILTRNADNYIPLDSRAEIANQSQADLFVSVHANYSDLPSARGVETYYTNFFSAPGSKPVRAKDANKLSGDKPAITPMLSAADLHERIDQSRRLAASVQRSLYGTLSAENPGLRDRGIKEAGFVVLTESAMPGILAEVSFVSSPTDEQKLRSDGYREQIAEALYKGIARYAAASKGTKVASAGK